MDCSLSEELFIKTAPRFALAFGHLGSLAGLTEIGPDQVCCNLPCGWEEFKKPETTEKVESNEWKTPLSQSLKPLKSFLKRWSVLLTPGLIRRWGEQKRTTAHLLFQRTLFGKGSIPQEDIKQLTLVSAIKTITDVISSYTTGKENIK